MLLDQLEIATHMSKGLKGLASQMRTIGATVREVLDNDMALQRHSRPMLNAAAEAAAAAHDAASRNLIEQILADEEQR